MHKYYPELSNNNQNLICDTGWIIFYYQEDQNEILDFINDYHHLVVAENIYNVYVAA